ncbi:MAG: hypothetical protein CMJ31_13260 [Phycisphaerae bacterium]|nr:hypothetical protein [Phycisphaerae bacterium]
MRHTFAAVVAMLATAPVAFAQEANRQVTTAADLARALMEAGIELPPGVQIMEDGSVSVPAELAPPEMEGVDANAAAPAPMAPAAAEPADDGLPGDPTNAIPAEPEVKWDNKIDMALNFSEGNSETRSFRAGYVGTRSTTSSDLSLDASYSYSNNDGETNQNKATAGVNHDWLLPESKWLYFAGGRADYDQFASWRYRVNANGGIGYELIDRENFDLTLRGGVGFAKEFGSDRNEIIPEGLLGADVSWTIAENQSLEATFRYFPDLLNTSDFRTVTTAAWRLDLDSINDGLGLTAGLRHEHQTRVDPGVEQNDLSVYAGLTWDF